MNAAELAHALGAVRSGRQWKCKCVAHEDREPSMIIFDGKQQVQVRCLAGCDQRDLIGALRSRGLWERDRLSDVESNSRQQQANASHETQMMMRARRAFDDATLTIGTPAQRYLEGREIWSVAWPIEDIRFHPRCPRERGVQPALVIAMRGIHDRTIQAVQRIYLTLGGQKDGAMMLGPVRGCAMMLQPVRRDALGTRSLHITEGLESALSVMAMDHGPVWAMGSCGAIERLDPIDGVGRLVIWADHDEPGLKAAHSCLERWQAAGVPVVVRVPEREGWDPADVWRDRCARQ